jgi:DNA helicase-2/ATP-dependent DNA helicase PcrA
MMDTLDSAQRAAATQAGTIQLVLAGPGSGKTTTLVGRFVHLVRQGVDRRRILALTFTRKAADEMKARIVPALDLDSAHDLTVATFHGFAFRHLRSNPQLAGLSEKFPLWDTPQQRHVFNSRRMWWNEESDILDIIAGAKERLLDAEGFAKSIDRDDEVLGKAVEFFRVYQQALRDAGAIDFADMVPLVVGAMDENPAYAAGISGAYDHVLVDEYQDVNPGQVALIDRFVRAGRSLWVVGDDDQTLYAFRAADVRFILDFPQAPRRAGSRARPQLPLFGADRRSRQALDRQQSRASRQGLSARRRNRRRDRDPGLPHAGDRGAAGGAGGRQGA